VNEDLGLRLVAFRDDHGGHYGSQKNDRERKHEAAAPTNTDLDHVSRGQRRILAETAIRKNDLVPAHNASCFSSRSYRSAGLK
jgi:hypothetical protein